MHTTSNMREARRAPGSEWLKDHPKALELGYLLSKQLIVRLYPLLTDNRITGYRTRVVDPAHRDDVLRLLTERDAEPGLLTDRLTPDADALGPFLRLDLRP